MPNKLKYLIIALISLIFLNGCSFDSSVYNPITQTATLEELPTVDNLNNLKKLLKPKEVSVNIFSKFLRMGTKSTEAVTNDGVAPKEMVAETAKSEDSSDYSTTNVQVKGVDESDIVKTDGRYIYRVTTEKIVVVEAIEPENLKQLPGVLFKDNGFIPTEIYIDNDHLVVIGSYNDNNDTYKKFYSKIPDPQLRKLFDDRQYNPKQTAIKIYDIKNKNEIKELREVMVEGNYLSSRKIGKEIYLVANKAIFYNYLKDAEEEYQHIPLYFDTALDEEFQTIPLKDIQYFPDGVDGNYIMLLGLNIEDVNTPVNVSAYLGNGRNIYSSLEGLYIAATNQNYRDSSFSGTSPIPNHTTTIYSFGLDKGKATFRKSGKVKGSILNQFSMDEHKGYFRIATTTGEMWRTDEHTSKNHVYILNQDLEVVGSVEDIAPTERIYSMRFMGDKGYMVTFRQTDPFFVIDLENPKAPKVLGYLKIPGYSDYLHPYDENHIIGFGKEVYVDQYGSAFNGGVKVAVFDVTDLKNPKEKFKIEIGDRGSDSPLSYDHKALLFSRERNLFAFPISISEVPNKDKGDKKINASDWGDFKFQGAYIYHLDMEDGFTLKNTITHITEEEYMKVGQQGYNSNSNIERLIYIKDVLYSLSNNKIKSFDLKTHALLDELKL